MPILLPFSFWHLNLLLWCMIVAYIGLLSHKWEKSSLWMCCFQSVNVYNKGYYKLVTQTEILITPKQKKSYNHWYPMIEDIVKFQSQMFDVGLMLLSRFRTSKLLHPISASTCAVASVIHACNSWRAVGRWECRQRFSHPRRQKSWGIRFGDCV
jgi:hypothetical protein